MIGVRQAPWFSHRQRQQTWVAALLLALSAALSCVAHAQPIDSVAPVIELEELLNGTAENKQVFTAQIIEDILLKDVTLYYRRAGQVPFTTAVMQPLGTTGYFSVAIPTEVDDLRTIEYYVQARDAAGNRSVSGFAFDPYQRTLEPPIIGELPVSTPPPAEPEIAATPLLKRRWVQIALGVIAAGAVASLASNSGGSDSQVVPLQFNLQ